MKRLLLAPLLLGLIPSASASDSCNFVSEYYPDVITDQKARLVEDVEKLKNNPMLKSDVVIEGAIYDVDTGRIDFIA